MRVYRLVGLAVMATLALAAPAGAAIEGKWTIEPREHRDTVQLRLERSWSQSGSSGSWAWVDDFQRGELHGLPDGNFNGPVTITLDREPGVFRLQGRFDGARGSGHFTFEGNSAFAADLERQGLGHASEQDLLRLSADGLDRAWIQEARSLGLRDLSLENLIRMQDNGVKPEFVQALAAAGYEHLSAEEVVRLANNDVTVDYVRAISSSNEKRPSVEHLVRFRNNGLEPKFVAALSPWFGPEELIRLHNNGVAADEVRDFRALGYESASADELIRLHDNGVTPAFARRAQSLHGRNVTIEELIKLHNNGVE
jgi:hypothetical protein